ncbi:MAG TPA: hypothetical protein VFW23_11780 [Tepidisphaeraceae bacterium]|nr:hypothetical protein [Tepidisphaeraceae bacterium]
MPTERQLRQRADNARRQLKATMHQTSQAIIGSIELSDEIAKCRLGDSLERHFARTAEIILRTRERLDRRSY